ncbi:PrgH/EprH family type III secretion apparatus protein, partial [Providencia heimbachae]
FIIKKINQFEEELEDKLIESIPNILKIDLSNPCQPVIKKLSSDSEVKSNNAIDNLFSSYFSCYKKIEIHQINSDELLKKSELGLTESDVKWHKIVKDKKIIYVIKDSLNDKQTISLINFTNSFYKEWGKKYIQFSISLENNVLAGKSFITNASGYVLLGNN